MAIPVLGLSARLALLLGLLTCALLAPSATATPLCRQLYQIAPTCAGTVFQSDIDGQTYRAEQSIEKVLCLMKKAYDDKSLPTLNGMHFDAAWESYRLARELSIWIYRVLEIPGPVPLKFAAYPTRDGNRKNCLEATSGPYITGGGTPLCRLLHEIVEFGDGSLIEFLTQALDYGLEVDPEGENFFNKYQWAPDLLAQVRRLGFEPYVRFTHQFNTRYIYNPNLDKFGQMIQTGLADLPPGYFGMSGGGGAGSGYEIFCANKTSGRQDVIITGGGGLNAGMSAGDRGVLFRGYGVGNAGVDVHIDGKTTSFGAFAGKSDPYGKVITPQTDKKDWMAFALAMQKAIVKMKECQATPGLEVILLGGGGTGVGFETFINRDGEERNPHAMDMGYQFQFALGKQTRLNANSDEHEIPFLVCPFDRDSKGKIPWRECLQNSAAPTFEPSKSPTNAPVTTNRPTTQRPTRPHRPKTPKPTKFRPTATPTSPPVDKILSCATTSKICEVATFTDAKGKVVPYKYMFDSVCRCYVQEYYVKAYLPPDKWPYMPDCTKFKPTAPDPNLNFDADWCNAGFIIEGCPKYPNPVCK